MRSFIIKILFVLISYSAFSQDTLMFKPDAECGKDAIMTNSPTWSNGSMPNTIPQPSAPFLRVEAWTANSNGSPEHDWRSIIEFEELKNIQSGVVNSAVLVLYAYPNYPYSNGGQAETNTSEVYRVIEPWEEDQVSWVTQPNVDLNGVVEIPQNNNYNLIEVDVTDMVQTMIDNPDNSFGFLLRQKDENPYGSMSFASSDYPSYSRAPELIIVVENMQYDSIYESCLDCNGTPSGTAVIDECGECLEPDDPEFNQSCADCNGIPNGTAVLDECEECLEPDDPEFNQSCLDCNGVLNGTAVLDECGVCLEPDDPEFNQSCADCNGTPNGIAVIDDCGECLEPDDPEFGQSCIACNGIFNGTAVLDECGVCLEPDDPEFNQSCADCNGIPNGAAVIDECGNCLEPDDPDFNQSCADCSGTPNGIAVVDECGACLEPDDPDFNQSCIDCNGIFNGTAVVDECGICLEPDNPGFNQSCADCNGIPNGTAAIDNCGVCLDPSNIMFNQSCLRASIFIPNAFSPNADGRNDLFQVFKHPDLIAEIKHYIIYNRWGGLVYEKRNLDFNDTTEWWDGQLKGEKVGAGVFAYYIEIEFPDGAFTTFRGDISVVR